VRCLGQDVYAVGQHLPVATENPILFHSTYVENGRSVEVCLCICVSKVCVQVRVWRHGQSQSRLPLGFGIALPVPLGPSVSPLCDLVPSLPLVVGARLCFSLVWEIELG